MEDNELGEPRRIGWGTVTAVVYAVGWGLIAASAAAEAEVFVAPGLLLLAISGLTGAIWTLGAEGHGCARLVGLAGTVAMQLFLAVPVLIWSAIANVSLSIGPKGRLLRLGGRARVARVAFGNGWGSEARIPSAEAMTPLERAVAAEAWHAAARAEHASVPAFARLSLQLVALGAPPELIEGAHHAALDEVGHARRCFAVAAAWGGLPWAPGRLPELAEALADRRVPDLERLARGSLRDGCLGEGVSAAVARALSETAEDPAVAGILGGIAADEERHAELGWEVVAWCLRAGGARVAAALRAEATRLDDHRAASMPEWTPLSPQRMRALGLPDRELAERCVEEEIAALRARLVRELET